MDGDVGSHRTFLWPSRRAANGFGNAPDNQRNAKSQHASANECCDQRPVRYLGKRRPGRESEEQAGSEKQYTNRFRAIAESEPSTLKRPAATSTPVSKYDDPNHLNRRADWFLAESFQSAGCPVASLAAVGRTLSAKFTMAAMRMLLANIPDGANIVADRAYDNNNVLDFIAWGRRQGTHPKHDTTIRAALGRVGLYFRRKPDRMLLL